MIHPSVSRRDPAVHIRQLFWTEREELRAHLRELTPQARRNRFSSPVTDYVIDRYVDGIDWSWDSYAAIGAFVGGRLRGVAECQLCGPLWERKGELAFSVQGPFQGRGIGSTLFSRMLSFASNRGLREVSILTDADNHAMRALAARHGMAISRDVELEGHLQLHGPTPQSLSHEFFGESAAWFAAGLSMLDRRKQIAA